MAWSTSPRSAVTSAAATAPPVKIAPKASAVSDAGVATVEVANPNTHVLRGTAKAVAGGKTAAKRRVKLGKLSVSTVRLRFDMAALRAADGRATIKLALRRANGKKAAARRKLKLVLPGGGPADPGPAPKSDKWVGRMGDEGAFDDLELKVTDGVMEITKPPLVPVYCFENGGTYRKGLSFEPFVVPGPWTLGQDATVEQSGISLNQIVTGGSRAINYKVTNSAQTADTVTGTLGMSYFDSQYYIFSNKITFVNCSGAQSFTAVPAG